MNVCERRSDGKIFAQAAFASTPVIKKYFDDEEDEYPYPFDSDFVPAKTVTTTITTTITTDITKEFVHE